MKTNKGTIMETHCLIPNEKTIHEEEKKGNRSCMNIADLKSILGNLVTLGEPEAPNESWSLMLLYINNSKRQETTNYVTREINLESYDKLIKFVKDVSDTYTSDKSKYNLDNFSELREYDAATNGKYIYRLLKDNELINENYRLLISAISTPDVEANPLKIKPSAFLLKGTIKYNGQKEVITLISMQNPITTLKHKFLCDNNTFREINEKILSLKTTIDVIIYNGVVYMLTLAGENLFNLERSYKNICREKVENIRNHNFIADFESFERIATAGHYPRMFVSFNDSNLTTLNGSINMRTNIAKYFSIPLNAENAFLCNDKESAEKLIKVLCQKGALEPFHLNAVEVDGSKQWGS